MSTSFISKHENVDRAQGNCDMNIQTLSSDLNRNKTGSIEHFNSIEEDNASCTSGSTGNGLPFFGYPPVQLPPLPINFPLMHQLQWQQVYPMHQYQQIPQGWGQPVLGTAVPYMMGPVPYPLQNTSQFYQVSTDMASNTGNTSVSGFALESSESSDTLMQEAETPSDCLTITDLGEETEENDVMRKDEENVWLGSCDYVEYVHEGGSNLFITWSGSKEELCEKLGNFKLGVRDVFRTSDENVRNVVFESHSIARKAFTMQHIFRLRVVPPKNSSRRWMRNPSPKFLVKFETKRQLIVRKGRAESHDVVGWVPQGCLIYADQLKGHRIRVARCEGMFMFSGGVIMEMNGISNRSDEKGSLGWISFCCKYSKESFVIRRSWNMLSDYIHQE